MTELDPRVTNLIASLRETGFIVREPTRSGSLTFTAASPDSIDSVKIAGAEMTETAWRNLLLKLKDGIGWTPDLIVEKRAAEAWKNIKHLHSIQRGVDPETYDANYRRMREVAEAEITDSQMVAKNVTVDAEFAFKTLTKHQIAAEWRGVADNIPLDIKRMLAGGTDFVKQRKLSKDRATNLGAVMWRGGWMLTHEGPAIAADDYIMDGQHRFEGILRTNAVAALRITYQLPNKTFAVIGTGKSRTAADVLEMMGIKSGGAMAAAVRLHHFYDEYPNDLTKWYGKGKQITPQQISELLIERYLDLQDSHRLSNRVCAGRDSIIKCRPAVAVAHHAALRRWPGGGDAAEEFWDVVRTGDVGAYSGGNHPAIRFRTWAVRWAGRTNALGNKKGRFMIEHLQVALRCWNAFVEERDPGKMSFDQRWGMPQPMRPKKNQS